MESEPRIIQKGSRGLRLVCEEVLPEKIKGSGIRGLIRKMGNALVSHKDGVALAAPQIGRSLRIFILSPKIFQKEKHTEPLVYINPVLIRKSRNKIDCDEGCLSVRGVYGTIRRFEKVTVKALDENGCGFTRGGSGLLAEIFQHEIDHLDGVLFIDSAKNLHLVKEDNVKA